MILLTPNRQYMYIMQKERSHTQLDEGKRDQTIVLSFNQDIKGHIFWWQVLFKNQYLPFPNNPQNSQKKYCWVWYDARVRRDL